MKDKKTTRRKLTFNQRIDRLLLRLAIIFSKLAVLFSGDNKLHTARFARIDELENLLEVRSQGDTSLLLGIGRLNHVLRVRPMKTRSELGNLLVVAPTRGGKGLLAVSQLLTWPHSVVVNDIKGDLFTQTAGYRATLGPVLVIDPTGTGNRYDPLAGKQTEDELLSSATQLLFRPDEGDGAIFTQRATVMLTQLFLAARQESASPLPYVRMIIRHGLVACASRLESIKPELATQFLNVTFAEANLSDRFLLSAWGTLDTKMRPLLTETVIRSLSGSDFTAGELMCGELPVTVYLRWPERDLLALAPLVRLLWGSIIDELLTTYDRKQGMGCNHVLLLVDEAGRTSIPMLADQATTVVGRKIYLWISVQSLSQLEAVYGRARATVLRENMESQIYYRPADLQTAKYLEDRLGMRSAYARSKTLHHGSDSTSEGLAERPIPLLSAQAITQLKDNEIIGFHRHFPPFRAKRMDWRRFRLLTQRHNLPSPSLSPLPELQSIPATVWQKNQGVRTYIDPDKFN
jgi:type IV secretion system protein VirD4